MLATRTATTPLIHSATPTLMFVGLTLTFSAGFWTIMLREGSTGGAGGLYVLGLMWAPGAAGLVTALIVRRTVRDLGWRLPAWRYLMLAVSLPLVIGALVYAPVWLYGAGAFAPQDAVSAIAQQLRIEGQPTTVVLVAWFVALCTIGMAQAVVGALGEEIGWRGFLVPHLAAQRRFRTAALVSGGVWAGWHYPLLFVAQQNGATPLIYGLVCFTAMVVGAGVLYAWLRLRSASLWPTVLLHASHNVFVLHFFGPLTAQTALTPYLTGESGALLALAYLAVAVYLWRRLGPSAAV